MMKSYPRLNNIYISDRLKERLNSVADTAVTTIIAPMGFGKTTAVTWWAKQQQKFHPDAVILRQMIDTDSASDLWAGLCRVLKGFPVLAEQLTALGIPIDASSMAIMAELIGDALSASCRRIYFVLDDLHIFRDKWLVTLIFYLSRRIYERIHFVLLSRAPIF